MAKKLLYSEVVSGNSSDEAQSEESGKSWLTKFQAEDEDTALHKAIKASMVSQYFSSHNLSR